jgi:hypothetical protein
MKMKRTLLSLLIAVSLWCGDALTLPRSQQHHSTVSQLIQEPHIAHLSNSTTEIFIIGTSHFACNSASEVQTLISTVSPDGVVLELDPERCLRLTKQSAGIDASGAISANTEELLYGADFVAAINTCQDMDIPLFLGDEYAQETRERLLTRLWDMNAYSPQSLVRSLFPGTEVQSRIDVLQSFIQDPRKLTPLVVTSSPPFMLSAFSLLNNQQHAIAYDNVNSATTMLEAVSASIEIGSVLLASFLLSCFLFNNVIVERDRVLAASTVRALNVLRSLKERRSIRKRWRFVAATQERDTMSRPELSKEESINESAVLKDVPLFTLKTPIHKDQIRNLNLFEPRWLKMIDQLQSTSSIQLGCIRCTNKFYSAKRDNMQILFSKRLEIWQKLWRLTRERDLRVIGD